jgi:hypothetical protein
MQAAHSQKTMPGIQAEEGGESSQAKTTAKA